MPDSLEIHYSRVVKEIAEGRVVFFLGAGANLCGRPHGVSWQAGQYLPTGAELSSHLANSFDYPEADKSDLLRVSQYVAVMNGSGPLYEELHKVFATEYPTTPLHELLASVCPTMRNKNYPARASLIVTTNYDDLIERAFLRAGESFDLVTYVADGEHRGKFWHWPPGGSPLIVQRPNEYAGLSPEQRSVILKIHGAVSPASAEQESFVITEDHYIDYLTRTDISNLVPVTLAAKLRRSHFLFLGYSLRDWNLRVILHRIWGEQKLTYKSWAIQLNPSAIESEFWRNRDVEILNVRLEEYVTGLQRSMEALPAAGGAP